MDALSNWQIQITMVIALHAPLDGLVSTLDLLEHTPEKADILLITKSVKNLEMDGPKSGLKKEKSHIIWAICLWRRRLGWIWQCWIYKLQSRYGKGIWPWWYYVVGHWYWWFQGEIRIKGLNVENNFRVNSVDKENTHWWLLQRTTGIMDMFHRHKAQQLPPLVIQMLPHRVPMHQQHKVHREPLDQPHNPQVEHVMRAHSTLMQTTAVFTTIAIMEVWWVDYGFNTIGYTLDNIVIVR